MEQPDMATHKKFFKVSMIITDSVLHDLMMLADGNAVKGSLDVQPVKHGGQDDNGRLKAQISGREFVLRYLQSSPRLAVRDAIVAGVEHGISKAGVNTAVNTLTREKVLRRVGVGIYQLASRAAAKKASRVSQGSNAEKKKPATTRPRAQSGAEPGDGTMAHRVLTALRKLQNGSGDGVALKDIKLDTGMTRNVSPTIADLMERNLIERTSPAHYRATVKG